MIGLGGIMTEIFDEKLLFILPVDSSRIKEKIASSKLARIFAKQRINISGLIAQAQKVVRLATENPGIKELDINPMIFYPDSSPVSVDVKVLFE